MLATPLSMSIAAGLSASASEMRAPVHRSVWQNNRTSGSAHCAAARKRFLLGGVQVLAVACMAKEALAEIMLMMVIIGMITIAAAMRVLIALTIFTISAMVMLPPLTTIITLMRERATRRVNKKNR